MIDELSEPEYTWTVADRLARELQPKADRAFDRTFSYEWMWSAREARTPALADGERRHRFATALNTEIGRLLDERTRAQSTRPIDFTPLELGYARDGCGKGSACHCLQQNRDADASSTRTDRRGS